MRQRFLALKTQLAQRILGQEALLDRLLIALLSGGHLLVEGVPGLAKTTAIKSLAEHIDASFHRIQFTPDLLPADLTGTEIFNPQTVSFAFEPGPLFHNFILADEVNRAPAKVQSALLEAMAEGQITVGKKTYILPELFLVMATQNPLEQAGTYPLPEAQRDRFLLHVNVGYPDLPTEQAILRLVRTPKREEKPEHPLQPAEILAARREILGLHMVPALEEYIVRLVAATRDPAPFDPALAPLIAYGASPRGGIAIDLASRAYAWLQGRDYVAPEDILAIAKDALRHRLILSFAAEADNISPDEIISRLLALVAFP